MKKSQRVIVPKNIWELMSDEDKKRYGHTHVTEEDIEKWQQGREKEMHDQFENWLNRNGFYKKYLHSRMDKKTGIGRGVFDFTVWNAGKIAFVEFKTDTGRLSQEQKDFYAAQIADGTPAIVARHYLDAAHFIEDVFAIVPVPY